MTLEEIRGRLFVTVAEVAEIFDHTDERTIRRAIDQGQIPAVKVGTKTLVPVPRLLALIEPADMGQPSVTVNAEQPASADAVTAAREILAGALRALDVLTGYQNGYQPPAGGDVAAGQAGGSGGPDVPPRLLGGGNAAAS